MKIFLIVYGLLMTSLMYTVFQKTRQQSISDGAEIYQDFCAQCHLDSGVGVPGAFPTLNKSDFLFENITRSIAAIKYGLKGAIVVNGESYNGLMANQGLDDEEIADVMNYILNSWDNTYLQTITTAQVQEVQKP